MPFILWILAALILLGLILVLAIRPAADAFARMAPFMHWRFAHRGLHRAEDGIPENSLAAFRRAVEGGYGIELDLHLTTDGQLVVFHDDTLDRVCGVSGRVDEQSWPELQQRRLLGTEERIPLFREVLETVNGKIPMIIEVKYQKNYAALCTEMMKLLSDYEGMYCVESFHPMVIWWMKHHAPQVARGLLADRYVTGELGMKHNTPLTWLSQELMYNFILKPHFIAYNHQTAAATRTLRLTHRLWHTPCIAWTIRSEEQETAARALLFDAVIFEGYLPAPQVENDAEPKRLRS